MPHEDEGRDKDDASDRGMPKTARKPPEARGQAWSRCSFIDSEGTNPTGTLVLDLLPPEPRQ